MTFDPASLVVRFHSAFSALENTGATASAARPRDLSLSRAVRCSSASDILSTPGGGDNTTSQSTKSFAVSGRVGLACAERASLCVAQPASVASAQYRMTRASPGMCRGQRRTARLLESPAETRRVAGPGTRTEPQERSPGPACLPNASSIAANGPYGYRRQAEVRCDDTRTSALCMFVARKRGKALSNPLMGRS